MKFSDIKFGDFITIRNGENGIVTKVINKMITVSFSDNSYHIYKYDENTLENSPLDIVKVERYYQQNYIGDNINMYYLKTIYEEKTIIYEINKIKSKLAQLESRIKEEN